MTASSSPPSSLTTHLLSALASRDARQIRRRLPSPTLSSLTDFTSNDYLSLSHSPRLRSLFLQKLHSPSSSSTFSTPITPTTPIPILGSGGSRLLTNCAPHTALESRLAAFFATPAALLFNSGYDANVAFFGCIPQVGDWVVYDEYIHASVHDGLRSSRVARASCLAFAHNSVVALRGVLEGILAENPREGGGSVFVAVESLYSMDGTFAPLLEIAGVLEAVFPGGNAYLVVDEAHATGIYGPGGRGRVAELGLEGKVLARLHTFGKALAATGAVVLTSTLIRDYLLNYARPLIYTTALSHANIIAADCSFDLLMDGTAQSLANDLLALSTHFTSHLHALLTRAHIPPSLLFLPPPLSPTSRTPNRTPPSPIIPLHTPHHPTHRNTHGAHAHALSLYLRTHAGANARAITWPTVPKGGERVRVCLHAGNTREEVERLARGVVEWAEGVLVAEGKGVLREERGVECKL